MDIEYPIENEYMKCVLQINGSSGPRRWGVWGGGGGGGGGVGVTKTLL